eukprot:2176481-Amphidinium_carterae.1
MESEEEKDEREVKRSRIQAILGPLIGSVDSLRLLDFLEHEVPECAADAFECTIGGLEELGEYLTSEGLSSSRREEIAKLEHTFKLFKVLPRSEIPLGTKVYGHKWVDTPRHGQAKSRLTVQDFKHTAKRHEDRLKGRGSYTNTELEAVQCPTPSAMANRALAWLALHRQQPMVSIDVVSAFPHAEEGAET